MIEYEKLKIMIKDKLNIDGNIDPDTNLLTLGLNSLQIMRLGNELKREGIKVSFIQLFSSPSINGWWKLIKNIDNNKKSDFTKTEFNINKLEVEKAFPMTDVQHAYWVGRSDEQTIGGVGTHAYIEFEGENINIDKFNNAFINLQIHHPMLRAKFNIDGTQEIMKNIYTENIDVFDFRDKEEYVIKKELNKIRSSRTHRKLNIESGQVIGVGVALLPNNKHRIYFDLDLLVADVQSLKIILRDFVDLYQDKELSELSKGWNFAEYLLEDKNRNIEEKDEDKKYWQDKLESLPIGSSLPLKKKPEQIKKVIFSRREALIDIEKWNNIKKVAIDNLTTPAVLLLVAYAKIIEKFSSNKHFLINIPLFNRNTDIPGIEDVVADFTTLILLEVDLREKKTFKKIISEIDERLHNDISHSKYSGVQLQREINKLNKEQGNIAPIVYACNLGMPLFDESLKRVFGKCCYMISQTPQVWLDFQLFEDEEGLKINWDSVDELFPDGLIDDMFQCLVDIINWLGSDCVDLNKEYNVFPKNQMENRFSWINKTNNYNKFCIHENMFSIAEKNPNNTAVIYEEDKYSYGYISEKSKSIANYLYNTGIIKKPIGITLDKGVNQVVSAFGVLASGNFYVPIGVDQPLDRRKKIHENLEVEYVITDRKNLNKIDWPENTNILLIEQLYLSKKEFDINLVEPNDTAYIILTSGSTGEPKGVEISHYSAWNTIDTINNQYDVTKEDCVIGISDFDFDLSVYDIFGVLSVGGKLLIVPSKEKRNPKYWINKIINNNVTVWNSVPILFDMLITQAEEDKLDKLPLKVALLSGDWIGLDLPKRLKAFATTTKFVALGGATEASIWSNYYEVKKNIPESWTSIPYGYPLKNQHYRVVDELGEDCPNWVVGELCIGGEGVAKGYYNNLDLTQEKFFFEKGKHWYKTGDLGRFWGGGVIEFLGRKDSQVKIRGHRIEIGEIESALKGHKEIDDALTLVQSSEKDEKHLVAYITLLNNNKSFDSNKDILQKIYINNVKEVTDEDFKNYIEKNNEITFQIILNILKEAKLLEKSSFSIKEVLNRTSIDNKYESLLKKCFNRLCKDGFFVKEEDCYKKTLYDQNTKNINNIIENNSELSTLQESLLGMFTGKINPLEFYYMENTKLSPLYLQRDIPGYKLIEDYYISYLKQCMNFINSKEKIRILDIGNRNHILTEKIINSLSNYNIDYTIADSSTFFLDELKNKLNTKKLNYSLMDINSDVFECRDIDNKYDIILTYYSLHRSKNINITTENIRSLLKENGILLLTEMNVDVGLMDITVGLLDEEYGKYEDLREESPLVNIETWCSLLKNSGFENVKNISGENCFIIIGQNKSHIPKVDSNEIKVYLKEKLVDYMIPKKIVVLNRIPITKNGKVNISKLKKFETSIKDSDTLILPTNETEKKLLTIWKEVFNNSNISILDNYFELGGDSLIGVRLISKINKEFGENITIAKLFEKNTIKDLAKELNLTNIEDEKVSSNLIEIEHDKLNQYEPFPLTDVQYSYFIGRNNLYELGNVSTHCYFEMDGKNLDYKKLCDSFNRLINNYDMMRVVILNNGQQKVLEKVPYYNIEKLIVEDEKDLLEIRKNMEQQVLNIYKWPLFDIKASYDNENNVRIFMSFDNIIFDGFSMFKILEEWSSCYYNEKFKLPKLEITFRDYVLGMLELKNSINYERDKKYWINRVEDLSSIPRLPIVKKLEFNEKPKFQRRSSTLEKEKWSNIKNTCKKLNITPTSLLMTLFTEVLKRWSENSRFTIVVTRFNRLPLHKKVEDLIGDFTTLTLLEVNNNEKTFIKRVQKLQKQLFEDLNHSLFSGVEVEREIRNIKSNTSEVIMPVVFTSGLGLKELDENKWLGKINYNVSQTPQIWLDHQVSERNGNLELSWDSVDEIFSEGVLDEMFNTYIGLLKELSDNRDIWNDSIKSFVKIPNLQNRVLANSTEKRFEYTTLDGLFLSSVKKHPEKIAVSYLNDNLSYLQLYNKAFELKDKLVKEGVRKGDIVGIYCEKGFEQIVSVIGVLLANAVYLPLDISSPNDRIRKIIIDSNVKVLLGQDTLLNNLKVINPKVYINVSEILESNLNFKELDILKSTSDIESLAYIIYTSGSTGEPKGVMISHKGAVNTILDVIDKTSISEKDSTIALSNLHFDLSVFDIFATLAVGGRIVLPEDKKKTVPSYLFNLIVEENISIWNSVPAYMKMLIDYLKYENKYINNLKQILLSGDWVEGDLIKNIQENIKSAEITVLGGATEASIWSNSFKINNTLPECKMMPYGKPLSNQRYYILNEDIMQCPNNVVGKLYIAGDGLALGYYNDPEKTNKKFVYNEDLKEKLYDTGDLGRYWEDGNIEFLGRDDGQVKLNGYRVELGEIENVINKVKGIKDSVVVAVNNGDTYQLIVYYVLENEEESDILEFIKNTLKEALPSYMVPNIFISIKSIPLSNNGKIDRKFLEKDAIEKLEVRDINEKVSPPETELEKRVWEIWSRIFEKEDINITDDFFSIGGNSLQAIQIVNYIKENIIEDFEIEQFFKAPTIKGMVDIIEKY